MSDAPKKITRPRMIVVLMETFGLSPAAAFIVASLILLVGVAAAVWVFQSAPPKSITVTTGPEGSSFQRYAEKYEKALKEHGITLRALPSGGSLENLQRLQRDDSGVDMGFVQGGLTEGITPPDLVSLGSVAYQPVWIYYRSATPIARLSELAGKRIAIGKVGSGTRALALTLLFANGINQDKATLIEDDAASAATALSKGQLDAVFLMGEAAPIQTLRELARATDTRLYDFTQGDAYVRKYAYLNRIRLPQGSFDLGQNVPAQDITLVGPTVELVARKGLNPAITEVLIEVAREVHGRASLLQRAGEFPAPLEHEFKISEDAKRYYKSGRGMLANAVHNIWLGSVINRVLVVFVPLLLVMVPIIRVLPILYRLRIHLRIYRCYRPLLQVERDATGPLTPERVQELLGRLDEIERNVDRLRVPASFGDQFYELRQHVVFVRRRLKLAAVK